MAFEALRPFSLFIFAWCYVLIINNHVCNKSGEVSMQSRTEVLIEMSMQMLSRLQSGPIDTFPQPSDSLALTAILCFKYIKHLDY